MQIRGRTVGPLILHTVLLQQARSVVSERSDKGLAADEESEPATSSARLSMGGELKTDVDLRLKFFFFSLWLKCHQTLELSNEMRKCNKIVVHDFHL
jgi:hypothetical protein